MTTKCQSILGIECGRARNTGFLATQWQAGNCAIQGIMGNWEVSVYHWPHSWEKIETTRSGYQRAPNKPTVPGVGVCKDNKPIWDYYGEAASGTQPEQSLAYRKAKWPGSLGKLLIGLHEQKRKGDKLRRKRGVWREHFFCNKLFGWQNTGTKEKVLS